MNWYRLWEVHCKPAVHYTHSHAQKVIYRFRSKIKARLDAVAVILFSIPVGLLTALIVSLVSTQRVLLLFANRRTGHVVL
jgi:hypothetical protein